MENKLDEFTLAYVETALWTIDPNPGAGEWSQHDDMTVENIDPATLSRMMADCQDFQECETAHGHKTIEQDLGRAGHDFFLTRNHHGAGFWDGDWEESEGKRLTALAHTYGETYLYIGDDGKIYG
jgi:hypothetical protein